MKKKIIMLVVVLMVCTTPISALSVPQNSDSLLYQDTIITLLSPSIRNALDNYYKDIYNTAPGFEVWSSSIRKIERPNGNRTSYFIIDVNVKASFNSRRRCCEETM